MATIIQDLRTVFSADTRALVKGTRAARMSVNRLAKSIVNAKTAFVGLAGTVGIGLMVRSITKTGAEFERTMAVVRGVTRATGQEFADLTAIARKMGVETEWTANQAAESLRFLGMAGFEANEAIKALPGTLDLATAGAIDLGRASDIATNALTAMQLPVESLGRVSDVFVGTITRTNTDMNMMAESFKYAAPVAKAFGYEIESLSSMIGILGNAGVQGSMAGTQLAFAMQKAAKIADQFNMSSSNFIDVLKEMNARGWEGSEVMKAFGMRGGRAALILRDMIPEVERLTSTLQGAAGETKTLADIMRDTVSGAWAEFKSALEGLKLDTFDAYNKTIREFLEILTKGVRELGESDAWIIALGESVKFVVGVLGMLTRSFLGVMTVWKIAVMGGKDLIAMIKEMNRESAEAALVHGEELQKRLQRELEAAQRNTANPAQAQNIKNIQEQIVNLAKSMTDSRATIKENTEWLEKHNKFMVEGQRAVKEMGQAVVDVDVWMEKLKGTIQSGTDTVLAHKKAAIAAKEVAKQNAMEVERWNTSLRSLNQTMVQNQKYAAMMGSGPGFYESPDQKKGWEKIDFDELGGGPGANEYDYEALFGEEPDMTALEDALQKMQDQFEFAGQAIQAGFDDAFTAILEGGENMSEALGAAFRDMAAKVILQLIQVAITAKATAMTTIQAAEAMKAALASTGWGLALIAISSLLSYMMSQGGGSSKQSEGLKELKDSMDDLRDSIDDLRESIDRDIYLLGDDINSWSGSFYDANKTFTDILEGFKGGELDLADLDLSSAGAPGPSGGTFGLIPIDFPAYEDLFDYTQIWVDDAFQAARRYDEDFDYVADIIQGVLDSTENYMDEIVLITADIINAIEGFTERLQIGPQATRFEKEVMDFQNTFEDYAGAIEDLFEINDENIARLVDFSNELDYWKGITPEDMIDPAEFQWVNKSGELMTNWDAYLEALADAQDEINAAIEAYEGSIADMLESLMDAEDIQAAIDFVKEYNAYVQELLAKFAEERAGVFDDIGWFMADLFGTTTEVDEALKNLDSTFRSWMDDLVDAGASIEEQEDVLRMWGDAIKKTTASFFENIRESVRGNIQSVQRSDWGQDEWMGEFERLSGAILDLDENSNGYYSEALALYSDQVDVLGEIQSLAEQQISELQSSYDSIGDLITNIQGGGDLAAGTSEGFWSDRYDTLLAAAMGEDATAADANAFEEFIPSFLNFMEAYTPNYADLTSNVVGDLEGVQANIADQLTDLELLADTNSWLEDIYMTLDEDLTAMIEGIMGIGTGDYEPPVIEVLPAPMEPIELPEPLDLTTIEGYLGSSDAHLAGIEDILGDAAAVDTWVPPEDPGASSVNPETDAPPPPTGWGTNSLGSGGEPKAEEPDDTGWGYQQGGFTGAHGGTIHPYEWAVPTREPDASRFLNDVGVDLEAISEYLAAKIMAESGQSGGGGGDIVVPVSVEIDGEVLARVVARQIRSGNSDLVNNMRRYING